MGKQQAVRMGKWKAVRFGGTKEPIELYVLSLDIGETNNVAGAHPDIVKRMDSIMKQAREGSEFNRFWPLPERRLNHVQWDMWSFINWSTGSDESFFRISLDRPMHLPSLAASIP
jgi:hypothetical protein